MVLRINSDYFPTQHLPVDLCNGEVQCFLCGTDWILKHYLDELRLQSVKVETEINVKVLTVSYCRGYPSPVPQATGPIMASLPSSTSPLQYHEGRSVLNRFCLFVVSVKQRVNLNSVWEHAGCWLRVELQAALVLR
jgi:hypothetical protein